MIQGTYEEVDINDCKEKNNGVESEKIIDALILSLLLHQEYAKKDAIISH